MPALSHLSVNEVDNVHHYATYWRRMWVMSPLRHPLDEVGDVTTDATYWRRWVMSPLRHLLEEVGDVTTTPPIGERNE